MKTNKENRKHPYRITARILCIVLAVVLLGGMLSSCSICTSRASTASNGLSFNMPGAETETSGESTESEDTAETGDATESGDTTETGDATESGDTAETGAETGETAESGAAGETGDSAETGENTPASMTDSQIEALGNAIIKSKYGWYIREQLIAATRGYDISGIPGKGGNYDKLKDNGNKPLPELEKTDAEKLGYVKNVLKTFDDFKIYADMLKDTDDEAIAASMDAVDTLIKGFQTEIQTEGKLGVIDQVLRWIGVVFGFLIRYPGFNSFILGTLYFAILLEFVMLPLGIRQQKNSIKQARLRPREMAIRNKYKGRNDQATMNKLNEEIRALYAKEGYSPMSGCLPLLITMPFLILLYSLVLDPMVYIMGAPKEMASGLLTYASAHPAAGGMGMNLTSGSIQVLSAIREGGAELVEGIREFAFFENGDEFFTELSGYLQRDNIPNFMLFGKLNMGLTPSNFRNGWWLLSIPVLTFLTYWGSGKLTRKFTFQPVQDGNDPNKGCAGGMMNVMMPAMSAFFTFMVPAAIGIYWMFKSIVGTVKSFVLSKVMPLPTFTEEDYKAAERELAGKDKNKPPKSSGTRNPNVRSLHYIDEEDYEVESGSGEQKKNADKADYVEPEEEKPHTADNVYSEGVTLKEDRPAPEEKAEKKKKKFFAKKKNDDE